MPDGSRQNDNDNIETDELQYVDGVDVSGAVPTRKVQRTKTGWGPDGQLQDVRDGYELPVGGAVMQELAEAMQMLADQFALMRDPSTGRMRMVIEANAAGNLATQINGIAAGSNTIGNVGVQNIVRVDTAGVAYADSGTAGVRPIVSIVEQMTAGADALRQKIQVTP